MWERIFYYTKLLNAHLIDLDTTHAPAMKTMSFKMQGSETARNAATKPVFAINA